MEKGKEFESLVTYISKCLYKRAVVTPDDKLVDKDTGRKRQIDISIRLADGPTEFLAIVEARDRSRKVDVRYLEEVKSKKESVGADKAIIVSKVGFAQTAVKKAQAYGIDLFTLEEALRENWSQAFSLFHEFVRWSYGCDFVFDFFDMEKLYIRPSKEFITSLRTEPKKRIILDFNGKPKYTAKKLANQIVQNPDIKRKVDSESDKKHDMRVSVNVTANEEIYIHNSEGALVRVGYYMATGQVWRQMDTFKPVAKHYRNEKTGELEAEVISSDDPNFEFELVLEKPLVRDKVRSMYFRRKSVE